MALIPKTHLMAFSSSSSLNWTSNVVTSNDQTRGHGGVRVQSNSWRSTINNTYSLSTSAHLPTQLLESITHHGLRSSNYQGVRTVEEREISAERPDYCFILRCDLRVLRGAWLLQVHVRALGSSLRVILQPSRQLWVIHRVRRRRSWGLQDR